MKEQEQLHREEYSAMCWFTSTPVSFSGGPDFFCRDSGLICKGLQSLGLSCKSVMPLPSHPEDITEDLIRTEAENLISPKWWQKIGAKKVVLYSWGHPKYQQVATAIRNSGAKVFINLDSSGILPTTVTFKQFLQIITSRQIRKYGPFLGILDGFVHSFVSRYYTPLVREPGRIAHLRFATVIGCISPVAFSLWRLWARKYAPDLVERMHLVPNPVADYINYNGEVKKQANVIAVGRWDNKECKRPSLLAQVIEIVTRFRSKTVFHVYGNPGPVLSNWYSKLPTYVSKYVYLHGKVNHTELATAYKQSQVSLCTSSHEGSHIASEEALCSGCTIVAPLRPELSCMLWYASYNSGQLAIKDSAKGLAETLLLELETWDRGERDPMAISSYWYSILSVTAVATKIRNLLE